MLDDLNREQTPGDVQFNYKGDAKSTTAMEKRLLRGIFKPVHCACSKSQTSCQRRSVSWTGA